MDEPPILLSKPKGALRTRMPATVEREKELIARIIAGETDLFHELIRPYERMVYLSILTMLRNDQEAEDASGSDDQRLSAFEKFSR